MQREKSQERKETQCRVKTAKKNLSTECENTQDENTESPLSYELSYLYLMGNRLSLEKKKKKNHCFQSHHIAALSTPTLIFFLQIKNKRNSNILDFICDVGHDWLSVTLAFKKISWILHDFFLFSSSSSFFSKLHFELFIYLWNILLISFKQTQIRREKDESKLI